MARSRVAFRRHLMVYILVNLLLVILWYFTSYKHNNGDGYWFCLSLCWDGNRPDFITGPYHDDFDSAERNTRRSEKNTTLQTRIMMSFRALFASFLPAAVITAHAATTVSYQLDG